MLWEPRDYQLDAFREAQQENIIVVLPTGSGKTFIAILLIQDTLRKLQENQTWKFIIFLAPVVTLVQQQAGQIEANLQRPVRVIVGSKVDFSNKSTWSKEFSENQLFAMTPQILYELLSHGMIAMKDIELLIFDECHHCKKNHPYNCIMRDFYLLSASQEMPKIFGMTASPLAVSPNKLQLEISKCVLCDITYTSDSHRQQHISGKKHQKKLSASPHILETSEQEIRENSNASQLISSDIKQLESRLNCRLVIPSVENFKEAVNKTEDILISDYQFLPESQISRLGNLLSMFLPPSDVYPEKILRIASELGGVAVFYYLSEIIREVSLRPKAKRLSLSYIQSYYKIREQIFCDLQTQQMEKFSDKILVLKATLASMLNSNPASRGIIFVTERKEASVVSSMLCSSTLQLNDQIIPLVHPSEILQSKIFIFYFKIHIQIYLFFEYSWIFDRKN
jgi:ERCC4-related helicase